MCDITITMDKRNKRKHDSVLEEVLFLDNDERLGHHKKRKAEQLQHQVAALLPVFHRTEEGQTVIHELVRLRDIRRQVFQLQPQPLQQQQRPPQLISLWFHQTLYSMQRFPHLSLVQCLGLHVLRQLVLCCTSHTGTHPPPVTPPHLLPLLPAWREQLLIGVIWEATLQRTLFDPVLQRDAAVQRAATSLTACCLSEIDSSSSHHLAIWWSMVTAMTQSLQFHTSDPVIQCNATATLCHLLKVVVRQQLRAHTYHRHNPTIVIRHGYHRPDKNVQHEKSRDWEIQTNDPTDKYKVDGTDHGGDFCAALRQLPSLLFESMERHLNDAAIFGNCVCLLILLQQQCQQHQQQQSLDSSSLLEPPTFSERSLPRRIRQGMQRHPDSLPVQHASLRWLRLQLQLHHHSSTITSHNSSTTRPKNLLLTVFSSSTVSQVMERFPNAVALQVCATQVLTFRLLNQTDHQCPDDDNDTAHASVWQALRRHPRALQLPSAAYFAVRHTTATTPATTAATRAFGGDPEHPWTVLQHVWQRLGLSSSTAGSPSSLPEPNRAAAAAEMGHHEDEEPASVLLLEHGRIPSMGGE